MAGQVSVEKMKVSGMTCTGCASTIERYLLKQGLADVKVSFIDGQVEFKKKAGVDLGALIKGLDKLGYQVVESHRKANKSISARTQLIISWIFTLPLIFHHVFPGLFHWLHAPAIQFLFACPVLFIGFTRFLPGAWRSIWAGIPNMDVTICLGALAAVVYSVIGWLTGHEDMIFFETAASILALVLLGNFIEQIAVSKTTKSIDELHRLRDEFGKMRMPSGVVVKIPLEDIKRGDFLIVNEGDSVPADAIITFGDGLVDESLLTGESKPVTKKSGDLLIGSSQVISGNFTIKVTDIGAESVMGKIIEMVKQAAMVKAPIQRVADRISAIFVPVVIVISVIAFLFNFLILNSSLSQSIIRSIAVLVISCPCAMGLATPTAIMVGLGRAMRQGILIRGASSLEILGKVKTIIYDKTGTLTLPKINIESIGSALEPETINAMYALESRSSHPIATAVTQYLETNHAIQTAPFKVHEIKGQGMVGEDEKGNVWHIAWSEPLQKITVSKGEETMAFIHLKDELKDGAMAHMQYLKSQHINPILLSGDEVSKVGVLAEKLNIVQWKGKMMPDQKAQYIQQLNQPGPIAMIGDGINDAPALSMADLGVSFAQASHLAIQSSEVILLQDRLGIFTNAIKIAKKTLMTIRQNLFWAFSYNIVAIPLAALGYLNPMWGVMFMAFSDLVVIGNSLRLRWIKI